MSFNKIIVVGYLGRDPELRYTPQGDAVCNFSMATTDKKRDKAGELQDVTTWFRVTLWRKQAELAAKYLTKGSQVYIEGRLRVEEWTDRDGNNRHTLEVQGTEMQFIGSGGAGGAGRGEDYHREESGEPEFAGPSQPASTAPASGGSGGAGFTRPAAADDDIPF
jgi:single-strand DNA-binding protein